MRPRAAVLFSGIGAWEIACEMNGVDVVWACEWDDWKRARYLERWPDAILYGDVAALDGAELVRRHGPLDILLGSPPCTDISAANVRGAGVDGEDSRYYLDAVRLARETGAGWCGFENSPRLRTRGADRVLGALGEAGYATWPLVVEAEDAGAPHARGRSFVVGARLDEIDRADAISGGLRQQPGRSGGARGAGAAEHQAHAFCPGADAARVGRLQGAVEPTEARAAAASRRVRGRPHAHADGDGQQARAVDARPLARQPGAAGAGRGSATPCHSDRARLAEWQGVGGDPGEKLTAAQRAALCPWDRGAETLAGYLDVADGLAARLHEHGLSDRAAKSEFARWRSATRS